MSDPNNISKSLRQYLANESHDERWAMLLDCLDRLMELNEIEFDDEKEKPVFWRMYGEKLGDGFE